MINTEVFTYKIIAFKVLQQRNERLHLTFLIFTVKIWIFHHLIRIYIERLIIVAENLKTNYLFNTSFILFKQHKLQRNLK